MKQTKNQLLSLAVILLSVCVFLSGCGGTGTPASSTPTPTPESTPSPTLDDTPPSLEEDPSEGAWTWGDEMPALNITQNAQVTIEMESGEKIVLELYYDKAPNTVCNFIALVQKKFYDGLIFHRVIEGFMIQGGDPDGTGMGGPDYGIKGEFTANGFAGNDISHTEGVLSMARSQSMDSAGSQFFICDADASFLDQQYAAFGKVISGQDVVHKIATVEKDSSDKPTANQVMKQVTVDTFGVDYPEPVTA